jgi:hypothetical protein
MSDIEDEDLDAGPAKIGQSPLATPMRAEMTVLREKASAALKDEIAAFRKARSGPKPRKTRISKTTLTVLSPEIDPYRLDVFDKHEDGRWFAEQLGSRIIHLRGLHYLIVIRGNVVKPNGDVYRNTDEDWAWLQEKAAKAARWLKYVPFEQITDNRNTAPEFTPAEDLSPPEAVFTTSFDVTVPSASDISIDLHVRNFAARQPFKLVFFGEKGSLHETLSPLCRTYNADLFLPTGEITDTQVYQMAKRCIEDGRPAVIFTLSDCDPAGYQMPVSIGRKLQALHDLYFSKLRFRVVPVGLTVRQANYLDLPSTPLKPEEKRADKWKAAFGREQTEIDAVLALAPDALRRIIRDAVAPYFDRTLSSRVYEARNEWEENAGATLEEISGSEIEQLRDEAEATLGELKAQVAHIENRIAEVADQVRDSTFPPFEIPQAQLDPPDESNLLCSSNWSWLDNTLSMKARKAYEDVDDKDED